MKNSQILRTMTEHGQCVSDAILQNIAQSSTKKDLGLTDETVQLLSSAIKGWSADAASKHVQHVQRVLEAEDKAALAQTSAKKKLASSID